MMALGVVYGGRFTYGRVACRCSPEWRGVAAADDGLAATRTETGVYGLNFDAKNYTVKKH